MTDAPDLAWFHAARYGMFIHYGPYSVAGRGEWVLNRERIPYPEYERLYIDPWQAEHADPRAWARLAKASGMGYVVLTTRHHDGFALWDTATTSFNAARRGPRRDLVAAFVEAVRAEGLRVGLYYSVADWSHPDYPGAYHRDWPISGTWRDGASRLRFIAYYRAQLEELMTHYGSIDMLWYDGCIPGELDGVVTNRRMRELQPSMLINERLGQPCDFHISEQSLEAKSGPWESCLTLNDNWGWHAGDCNWKDGTAIIRALVTAAGRGGNLLLNIGPRGDGTIPQPSVDALQQAGHWLARHREFLPDLGRSPFGWNNSALVTVRGSSVYLHLFCNPGTSFCWPELANPILGVHLVPDGTPLPWAVDGHGRLTISGLSARDPIATVIRIDVTGVPTPRTAQGTFWIPA